MSHVEIAGPNQHGTYRIAIDGHDISSAVTALHIHLEPFNPPVVRLTVVDHHRDGIALQLPDAVVRVLRDHEDQP